MARLKFDLADQRQERHFPAHGWATNTQGVKILWCPRRKDILPQISESVTGLCHLMTGIHSAIGSGTRYEEGDVLTLVGTDDDIVGYWPAIPA